MKKIFKNLLPKEIFEGVALNQKFSKISLRLPKRFTRLFILLFLLFVLSGYYPTFTIPPVRSSTVYAQVEQRGEVVAESFSQPVVLPHPGYLSTQFSSFHPGVDIASGLGMPVHPINSGVVEEAGTNFFGLGKFVTVSHQKGFKSKYAHLGKIYVKVGQEVTSESTLGEVGLTGYTSGPHTHLEITLNGKYINPQTILPDIPDMPRVVATK